MNNINKRKINIKLETLTIIAFAMILSVFVNFYANAQQKLLPHGIYSEEIDIIATGNYQPKQLQNKQNKQNKYQLNYQSNEIDLQLHKVLNSLANEINDGDVISEVVKQTRNLSTARFDSGFSQQKNKIYHKTYPYSGRTIVVKSNVEAPTLSRTTIYNLRKVIKKYRKVKEKGGWGKISKPPVYGQKSEQVIWLRNRLIKSGDLGAGYLNSDVFDSFLKRALQKFQLRHGIKVTGIINKNTLETLNVSVDERIQQLKINLLRITRYNQSKKNKYILVNIPAARVEAVKFNRMVSVHKAVVGQLQRKTPIVTANITSVNFNPKWYIPRSIIVRDLIPIVRRRPQYLKRMGIRVYDRKNNALNTENINWYDKKAERYLYRQDPGRVNSLGLVKIHFPNKYSIFLHDTPEKIIFNDLFRAYSSGCVRVQNIRQLIYFLLKDKKSWSKDKIDRYMRNGKTVNVKLDKSVTIITAYITAWADNNGNAHFRQDIYQRDGIQYLVSRQYRDNKNHDNKKT